MDSLKRIQYNKDKRDYYKNHREYFINKSLRWRKNNYERVLEINRKSRVRIKIEVLSHYGDLKCLICGSEDVDTLSLDHVNHDGKNHRKEIGIKGSGTAFYYYLKRNNFPNDPPLQILCIPCNSKKQ